MSLERAAAVRRLQVRLEPGASVRRLLLSLGCGVLAIGVTACESTEQESAQLARKAAKSGPALAKLKLGKLDRAVRASQVTLVKGAESAAIAVHLSSSKAPLANLPIAVDVRGSNGSVLYSNETAGLEASLQRVALLSRGGGWWVDNQVLGVHEAGSAHVRVGTAGSHALAGAAPALSVGDLRLSTQDGAHVIDGVVSNHGSVAQRKLPVYAVTLHGSRVTAAGSAVIASLPAGASKVAFEVFLVGNPAGSVIQATVTPTVR